MTQRREVESKYRIGQSVTVVPPADPGRRMENEHLMSFAGQTATITDVVGAHLVAIDGIHGLPLYYLTFAETNKKATAPEEWLTLAQQTSSSGSNTGEAA
jgi:hypothetical protein